MNDTIGKLVLGILALALVPCGCGGPTAPPPGSKPLETAQVTSLSVEPPGPEDAEEAQADEDSISETTAEVEAENQPPAVFQPPYPERRDLFQPPQLEQIVRASSSGNEESAADIALLGFIGTGQRRAILQFDGEVRTVLPGDEYSGVEVVDMTDTEVTLRRGRVRWTLTVLVD